MQHFLDVDRRFNGAPCSLEFICADFTLEP
jgi:hypothetical protein